MNQYAAELKDNLQTLHEFAEDMREYSAGLKAVNIALDSLKGISSESQLVADLQKRKHAYEGTIDIIREFMTELYRSNFDVVKNAKDREPRDAAAKAAYLSGMDESEGLQKWLYENRHDVEPAYVPVTGTNGHNENGNSNGHKTHLAETAPTGIPAGQNGNGHGNGSRDAQPKFSGLRIGDVLKPGQVWIDGFGAVNRENVPDIMRERTARYS